MHPFSCARLSLHVCLRRRFSIVFSGRAIACLAAMNPQYFEYQIDRGVEWIRIYSPGTWRPVPDDAPVLDPVYASTYREWRRSYRFQVYWSEDSTGGTSTDPIVTPSSYVSYFTSHWTRDARECRRQFLGGLIGSGWGVARAVTTTIL